MLFVVRLFGSLFLLLFRTARWAVGRSLQLVGLGTLVVVFLHWDTVYRELHPEIRSHVRSGAALLHRLEQRWNPPPPIADAPPIEWPVHSRRISSGFGTRTNPVTGRTHVHRGIDLPVPIGTPVLASRSGRVKTARQDALNGKYVVLVDDASGLRFAYCHLSKLTVVAGQRVAAGTVVGESGNTGRSTGPHLHFGAWFHGKAVDPRRLASR